MLLQKFIVGFFPFLHCCWLAAKSFIFDSFVISWTVVRQAPLSMEFPRQEYWSGLAFPSPRGLPNTGIKPRSPVLQADSLPSESQGSPSLGYLTNRNLLSHSSGDWKSEIKCWQGWFLTRPLSLVPGILFLCPHLAFLLCKGILMTLPFLTRIPILLDQGLTLKTSFNSMTVLEALSPNIVTLGGYTYKYCMLYIQTYKSGDQLSMAHLLIQALTHGKK